MTNSEQNSIYIILGIPKRFVKIQTYFTFITTSFLMTAISAIRFLLKPNSPYARVAFFCFLSLKKHVVLRNAINNIPERLETDKKLSSSRLKNQFDMTRLMSPRLRTVAVVPISSSVEPVRVETRQPPPLPLKKTEIDRSNSCVTQTIG